MDTPSGRTRRSARVLADDLLHPPLGAQPGAQPGIRSGTPSGTQLGTQPGTQSGIQSGIQPAAQSGIQSGIHSGTSRPCVGAIGATDANAAAQAKDKEPDKDKDKDKHQPARQEKKEPGDGDADADADADDDVPAEGEGSFDSEGAEDDEDLDEDEEIDSFTTSEIVTVYVGGKRKRFFLHRELICDRSPFMDKCLKKGHFDEGYKNELYLPEDDPKAFSIIVDWIYRSRLPNRTEPTFDLADMSAAYCMADKFGMEELQNGIMDNIRASFSRREAEQVKPPNFSALALTHLTGPHKSPLKRFFVEHLVHHMMRYPKWYGELKRNEPARIDLEEMFKIPDLVMYIMKKIWQFQAEPWKDPAVWDKCCYHVHANTVCPAKAAAAVATKAHIPGRPTAGPGGPGAATLSGGVHGFRATHGSWPPATMGVWNPGVGW